MKCFRTPLNSSYPSCHLTFAELVVYTDGSHEQVTEILGLRPSHAQNQGEIIKNSRGNVRAAKLGYWCLSSENIVSSKDLRHHLNWLLEQLEGKSKSLAELQSESGISMNVNCVWWSKGTGGPTLWPAQMLALSKLNLELTFDFVSSD